MATASASSASASSSGPSPATMNSTNASGMQAELELGYQHTLMYGRYTRDLGEYAKEEAKRLRDVEKERRAADKLRTKELRRYRGKWTSRLLRATAYVWRHTFAKIGEDWVFLALLGVLMALISFTMDYGISMANKARLWMYKDLATHPALQYLAWISLPVFLVLFSAGFVHVLAPQAIGSGIPEMKTILRGVVLKEYLTFRTLIAKAVGLTATLGSGMPLGKEGPLVHIASIVATLLSQLVTSFHGIYENESRNSEMLAAACAVGVSCCFAAPIGGVLFSIEVTSVYFAIRNYWRGFFSAVFGALMFRLLAYWFNKEETITAIFRTNFQVDFAYDPQELFIYALVGAFGGLCGACFVYCHRHYVLFMRKNKKINFFLQKNRFIYPGIISLFIASLYFPLGFGQFLASELTTQQQILSLFSNFTWYRDDLTVEQAKIVSYWSNDYTSVFINLGIFIVVTFWLTIVATTLPVPSGAVIPIFKMGAAFGRIIGEAMHLWFPEGLRYGAAVSTILPGGYAIVGAAAFSAGVTHSISICVVISEMTGQIRHIVPVMIAVLVSNAISTLLQPSLYDSIIMIKKLPYLPDIVPTGAGVYSIFVEDFMVRNIKYVWDSMTYSQLRDVLKEGRKLRAFPLVDSPTSMILLGSIPRHELIALIETHIGRERRLQVAAQWQIEARIKAQEHLKRMHLALPAPPIEGGASAVPGVEQRRPSRFEVVPASDDPLKSLQVPDPDENQLTVGSSSSFRAGAFPRKSILKKTNSFTMQLATSPMTSPVTTPYSTVTGADSRIRQAFEAIFRKAANLADVHSPSQQNQQSIQSVGSVTTCTLISTPTSPISIKKVQLPRERVIDMSPEEQKAWEEAEMSRPVLLLHCHVDPAPFQLVERTSLLKVHSMFSLLGINLAYVTVTGRLIGVVSLSELRKAIEEVNSGVPAMGLVSSSSMDLGNRTGREHSPGAPEDIEAGLSNNTVPVTAPPQAQTEDLSSDEGEGSSTSTASAETTSVPVQRREES